MDGRTKIRPAPPSHKFDKSSGVDVGSVVDAWWHDGWWEGIIVETEPESKYHVYFPGMTLLLFPCIFYLRFGFHHLSLFVTCECFSGPD